MVNFTKIGITQGLNYTGELASKITSLKYSIEDDLRKIEDLFSNRFTEIQGCIERCSSDVQTGRDVLAHNRTKRSEFNMEYNSARKELESLRNSETPNQEEISKYEQIKAYAEQLQNAAERMIRQLETVLSRIEMEKFKLENARDRLKKAHKRLSMCDFPLFTTRY